MLNSRIAGLLVVSLSWLLPASAPLAAEYPLRPIHIVVGYPPGGLTDIVARAVAERFQEKLGQPGIVDNRPGAGSELAMSFVARAAADGYTLLFGVASMTINRALKPDMKDDPLPLLRPLGLIGRTGPYVLIARQGLAANNLQELFALARKSPGSVTYASYGVGAHNHFIGEWLGSQAKVQLHHVPYTGSAPSLTALMGGHVDLDIEPITQARPLIESGKAKALAVADVQRSPLLPNVPTMAEAGGTEPLLATSWYGLMAPKDTPGDILARLEKATIEISKIPSAVEALRRDGGVIYGTGAAAFTAFINEEMTKWRSIAVRANIKSEQ